MITLPGFNSIPATSMDLMRLILINQMALQPERVNVYDEKWVMPNIEDMFLTLEYRNATCISNNSQFINTSASPASTPIEIQTVNMFEKIVVGVFSRTREAIRRKEEVLMAFSSSYAQLMQETWSFKVSRNASIEDLSVLEGNAMLRRFDIEFSVFAWYQKTISPNWIIPPYLIQVTANDAGTGIIKQTITQLSQLPIN